MGDDGLTTSGSATYGVDGQEEETQPVLLQPPLPPPPPLPSSSPLPENPTWSTDPDSAVDPKRTTLQPARPKWDKSKSASLGKVETLGGAGDATAAGGCRLPTSALGWLAIAVPALVVAAILVILVAVAAAQGDGPVVILQADGSEFSHSVTVEVVFDMDITECDGRFMLWICRTVVSEAAQAVNTVSTEHCSASCVAGSVVATAAIKVATAAAASTVHASIGAKLANTTAATAFFGRTVTETPSLSIVALSTAAPDSVPAPAPTTSPPATPEPVPVPVPVPVPTPMPMPVPVPMPMPMPVPVPVPVPVPEPTPEPEPEPEPAPPLELVDGMNLTGDAVVYLALSSPKQLALLGRVSGGGVLVPAGRSYDGHPWEGVEPDRASFACDGNGCAINTSSPSGDSVSYRITLRSRGAGASTNKSAAFFLMQTTFGPTRAEIVSLSADIDSSSSAQTSLQDWIVAQMAVPATLHRVLPLPTPTPTHTHTHPV